MANPYRWNWIPRKKNVRINSLEKWFGECVKKSLKRKGSNIITLTQ